MITLLCIIGAVGIIAYFVPPVGFHTDQQYAEEQEKRENAPLKDHKKHSKEIFEILEIDDKIYVSKVNGEERTYMHVEYNVAHLDYWPPQKDTRKFFGPFKDATDMDTNASNHYRFEDKHRMCHNQLRFDNRDLVSKREARIKLAKYIIAYWTGEVYRNHLKEEEARKQRLIDAEEALKIRLRQKEEAAKIIWTSKVEEPVALPKTLDKQTESYLDGILRLTPLLMNAVEIDDVETEKKILKEYEELFNRKKERAPRSA